MYLGLSLLLLIGSGVLGARLLRLPTLLERLMATAIIAVALVVLISLTVGLIPGGYRPLPLTIAAALCFLPLFIAAWRTGRMVAPPLEEEERDYLTALGWIFLLTMPVWLWLLFNGLLLPPIYWDELYYHLVAPAVWAREGQIHFFSTSNPFVAGYPANFGLLWGWSMTMTGTDVWVDLGGMPFVLVGLAVVLALCYQLGVEARHGFWAGLLFVTTPLVIFHAKAAYIDLPMSATFGVATYFLYRFVSAGERSYLLLGAMAMGLMVGAKYSGPYLAIAGALPVIYQWKRMYIKHWSLTGNLLWYGVPVAVLGAFWYVRNLFLFQNPLHPMRLTVAGITIFNGRYEPDAFTFTKPENGWVTLGKALLDLEPAPLMDSFYSGFGPQLLLLAIPATLLFLWKEKEQRPVMLLVWLLPLLWSVATLPARFPRYLIHLGLFLLPFLAWLLQDMSTWPRRLVKLVAVSFVAYSILIATPIYPLNMNAYRVSAETIWAAHGIGYGSQGAIVHQLNEEVGRPLRIITGPMRLTYPALGERWQNELIYVPPTDEATWLEGVKRSGADLYWYDEAWDPAVEKEWIANHPEIFVPYYEDEVVHIFWIRTDGGARP
ncbi:MAG: ArnT family glycosyltransferase [Bacillota bacterium]